MCCDLAFEAILAIDNQYDRVCDIDVSKLPQWYNNHYMNVINALKHDDIMTGPTFFGLLPLMML